jgi:hypothetical protein
MVWLGLLRLSPAVCHRNTQQKANTTTNNARLGFILLMSVITLDRKLNGQTQNFGMVVSLHKCKSS